MDPQTPPQARPSDLLYQAIRAALEAGFEVTLRPDKKKKTVNLSVTEAKNGAVNGCDVDLNPFEWALVGEGIATRINEAISILSPSGK